jgi:hypothetical protein
MQTKTHADLTLNTAARRSADKPGLAAPIELAPADLRLVGGGLAPRGGWSATADSTLTTTDTSVQAPRGGW